MKYDKDTMNSLQEAYASVNEVKYYSGKDRNKKTGTPKKLQNQSSKTSDKKPKGSMPTGGDGTAYMDEAQEHEGMKYSDKKKQSAPYKNNPAFGDESHHSNAKNK